MATEAERVAAVATWHAATGTPDPKALAWANAMLDRVETDQPAARAS